MTDAIVDLGAKHAELREYVYREIRVAGLEWESDNTTHEVRIASTPCPS